MTQSLLCAGSYADSTNSNRSDDNTEHRNSIGREETLKSFDSKIPLQFKPSKVTEPCSDVTFQDHTDWNVGFCQHLLDELKSFFPAQTATLRTGLCKVSSMDNQPGHSQSPTHCSSPVITSSQSELRMTFSPTGREPHEKADMS